MKNYIKHALQSLIFLNCFKIHDFDAILRIKNFSLHLISHNDAMTAAATGERFIQWHYLFFIFLVTKQRQQRL